MNRNFFYRPEVGVAADFIPFYDNGEFKLFYLHDYRDVEKYGEGTPWDLLTTTDFVTFEEQGEVVPRGSEEDQDLYIFTGCIFKEREDLYHLFYTGHNPHLRKKGQPEQAVMHATSSDLKNWTKIPEDTFYAPLEEYEAHDWRDPLVFYNEKDQNYKMLLTARLKDGLTIRRGCTALCSSTDLKNWVVEDPLWVPNQYFAHECPDIFKIGEWWYQIFSEFTDDCQTRYVMSKDLKNWVAPKNDTFDGRAYYAAKSASDGAKRYLFGWVPTKDGNVDSGFWQWGGNLVVHEIYQKENGELGQRIPTTVSEHFSQKVMSRTDLTIESQMGYKHILFDETLPRKGKFEIKINGATQASAFGFLVNYDAEADSGYAYTFDQRTQLLNFNVQPNTPWNFENFYNVWRTYEEKEEHILTLVYDEDVFVAYIDDEKALSTRVHRHGGQFGFFVVDGAVELKQVELYVNE